MRKFDLSCEYKFLLFDEFLLRNELAMERRYTSLEGDLDNPDQSQIEVPLNPQIQKMFCEDAIESIPGRSCVVQDEVRL